MTAPAIPRATARLQFFAGFTLDDAIPLVPYFSSLGISHLYASPLLKARPGSTHCYDIVAHDEINPELGGLPALERLVAALRRDEMGLILDIVPNHMGVGGADNEWWLDVLEWGHAARHAEFFDIDWTPTDPSLHQKLLAPFLGAAYGEVLANNELVLSFDAERGRFFIAYHEHYFPLSVRSTAVLLRTEPALAEFSRLFAAAARTGSRERAYTIAGEAKAALRIAVTRAEGEAGLKNLYARFDAATPDGRRRLHELLERQHYRLAWWRAAADEINWRRFFDINTLAGMRVEQPRVFDATHHFLVRLYERGLIDGVRVDHIDGLADPRGYARKLRRVLTQAGQKRPPEAPPGPPYIVVEKILAPRERLEPSWQVDGTTGYDFMDQVGAVLHDPEGEVPLTSLWTQLTGRPKQFQDEEEAARRQILRDNLASELGATAAALHRLARRDLATRDDTLTAIRRALTEILVHFPVYRVYAGAAGAAAPDQKIMDRALAGARRQFRRADLFLLDELRRWLADEPARALPAGAARRDKLRAQIRFQQLSAPTAAKSVEDTAFYRYGRLLSRNEVGSNPGNFSLSQAAFHAACLERGKNFPSAMLATATHDHKRGEDSRARLAVLAELPAEWETLVTRLTRLNAIIRQEAGPSMADELMLYQTIIAAWPLTLEADDAPGLEIFTARLAGWLEKSMREAKLASEWAAPNEAYEAAAQNFLRQIFDPSRPVLGELAAFAARIAPAGALNGLTQTLLRLTTPGVPDLYQGTEFWDFSLVDPDNRRPVDFSVRAHMLERGETPATLLRTWQTGHVKQAIIARALRLRVDGPDLFAKGKYQKLEAEGAQAAKILAFTRALRRRKIAVIATRLAAPLLGSLPLIPPAAWEDTNLTLPPGIWTDALSGRHFSAGRHALADLLADLPIALLHSE